MKSPAKYRKYQVPALAQTPSWNPGSTFFSILAEPSYEKGVFGLKRGILRSSKKLYRQMGKNHTGDAGAKPVDARVARRRQDALGRRLRQMYDDVVNESVPDEFMSFLEKADERDPPNQKKSADGAEGAYGTEPVESAPAGRTVKTEP
jgi:hypothetical protein